MRPVEAMAAALVLLVGPPAAAQAEPPAKVVEDPDRIVCRSVRNTTSRVAKRVCETVAERERRRTEQRRRVAKGDTDGADARDAMKLGTGAARATAR